MLSKTEFENARLDCAIKQKKGLHFILASILIWTMVFVVQLLDLPILTKNLFVFCCTAPLMPIALLVSKIIKVDFQNKENPLTILGIIFSINQIVYLLIAMWVYYAIPNNMVMVIAMIFGAHLMPFGWLYKSKTYFILSVFIPISALIIGLHFEAYILAIFMIVIEIVFSVCLAAENKLLAKQNKNN